MFSVFSSRDYNVCVNYAHVVRDINAYLIRNLENSFDISSNTNTSDMVTILSVFFTTRAYVTFALTVRVEMTVYLLTYLLTKALAKQQ